MNRQEYFPEEAVDGTGSDFFLYVQRIHGQSVVLDPSLNEGNLKTVSAFFSLVQIFFLLLFYVQRIHGQSVLLDGDFFFFSLVNFSLLRAKVCRSCFSGPVCCHVLYKFDLFLCIIVHTA